MLLVWIGSNMLLVPLALLARWVANKKRTRTTSRSTQPQLSPRLPFLSHHRWGR